MQNDEINKLIERIVSLEIDNKKLKAEVKALKKTAALNNLQQKQSNNKTKETIALCKDTHLNEHDRARKGFFLDRYKQKLDIGDRVLILTEGAHTSRSRRGKVCGFDNYRNRVYILDEHGVTQERAPKNVRLD